MIAVFLPAAACWRSVEYVLESCRAKPEETYRRINGALADEIAGALAG
jgi:hypothetical protein